MTPASPPGLLLPWSRTKHDVSSCNPGESDDSPGPIFQASATIVLRTLLKSKLHRALVTDANVDYEGSITIPTDLMAAADLWDGEKVLVTSITSGARLETYVIPGEAGSGHIVINGAAAHLINNGHRITIMAWAQSDKPVAPKRLLLNKRNEIVDQTVR